MESTSANCPICNRITESKHPNTPYWICGYCDAWFQHPAPSKTYEGPHELEAGASTGHLMSDEEKKVNADLAGLLFDNWLKKKEGASTLDIGSKYPYLAHCLKHNHKCDAYGNDAITSVDEYSKQLQVPMIAADIETVEGFNALKKKCPPQGFDLITMVHVFEHMHDPVGTLRKLRSLMNSKGFIFLRMPDHEVDGFERDLTENHYTIHPFFHCLNSALETLVQADGLFTVAETYTIAPGQRDYLLRPAIKAPTIVAGMIAKNEERDLPKALRSIKGIVEGVAFVDTGSIDRTIEIAHKESNVLFHEVYTKASTQDDSGNWQLWDFGKARNRYCHAIEHHNSGISADWVFWVDADDEIINPEHIKRAVYLDQYDTIQLFIDSGGDRWTHHRLWRTGKNVHYEGACHEYPTIGGLRTLTLKRGHVKHDAAPHGSESSNARNLRILQREYDNGKRDSRTVFYLAQTHRDGGRFAEAERFYLERVAMTGNQYEEERMFALLYLGRCQRAQRKEEIATRTLLQGAMLTGWSEFWCELMWQAWNHGDWTRTLGFGYLAYRPDNIPMSQLWRERNRYADQPARFISQAYDRLGDNVNAIKWADIARTHIQGADKEWDDYTAALVMKKIASNPGITALIRKQKPVIALHRPGAIGDVLMTLNLIPALRAKYPDHSIEYFTNVTALGFIFDEIGVKVRPASEFNPTQKNAFNLIGYPLHEGYPGKPMRKHLIEYFADEMGLEASRVGLTLNQPKNITPFAKYITIQTTAGWSKYKEWPTDGRWTELLRSPEFEGYAIYQVGGKDDVRITPDASQEFMGDMKSAVSLIANASLHIGIDSFANHLTHYQWIVDNDNQIQIHQTPGIILFGSTQPLASGYPENVNLSIGLPCQPCFKEDPKLTTHDRGVCDNPPGQTYAHPRHRCLNELTVEQVRGAVRQVLGGKRGLRVVG